MKKKLILFIILGVLLDQVIKIIIANTFDLNQSINIIDNFFRLTYVHNYGAAFSILSGNRIFLIIVTIISLLLIYFLLIKKNNLNKLETVIYSLLIAGILGNFIDRIIYGYVIDYLDFNIFGYNFPIFNIADTLIVISVIILLILSFKGDVCKSS